MFIAQRELQEAQEPFIETCMQDFKYHVFLAAVSSSMVHSYTVLTAGMLMDISEVASTKNVHLNIEHFGYECVYCYFLVGVFDSCIYIVSTLNLFNCCPFLFLFYQRFKTIF